MQKQIITAAQAAALIKNGDTVATDGFIGAAFPEELAYAVEQSFLSTGSPNSLTVVYGAGQGDSKTRGVNHFGHEGLISKVIGGHWGLVPMVQKLALENKIEAYNLPQGVMSHMFRDIAAKKPGTITHIGLNTFVDPRLEGGKLNERTTKDIVELIKIHGNEYLLYNCFPIDVALLRGTTADSHGNITMEKEAVTAEMLSVAQAAKNSGGKVFVQVERVVEYGTLDPKQVVIPGIFVDAIVVASDPKFHMQTFGEAYNPAYVGKECTSDSSGQIFEPERRIICKRAAKELIPGAVINLGIGMPEGVAQVAKKGSYTITVEAGPIGGTPAGGVDFGCSSSPEAIIDQPYQFDFYQGGGLDLAFLGLAQTDEQGNVNVSKFGTKIAGCGGFIDITQTAKKVVYCGTFTAKGLVVSCRDGKLVIESEGSIQKFIKNVQQITFSGKFAAEKNQPVLYVTERAVFELTKQGMTLIEAAPGIDVEKDILAHMEFSPKISENLKTMDADLFV